MDIHLTHVLRNMLEQLRTSLHQLEIGVEQYTHTSRKTNLPIESMEFEEHCFSLQCFFMK